MNAELFEFAKNASPFIGLFEINLSSALIIVFILLTRSVWNRRFPKRAFTVMWLVAAIRLLIPLSVPISFNWIAPDYNMGIIDSINGNYYADISISGETKYFNSVTEQEIAMHGTVNSLFMIIAPIVGAVIFSVFVFLHVKNIRRYADSLLCTNDEINMMLSAEKFRRNISIRTSDRITAPFTYGIIRPVIILPKKLCSDNSLNIGYILAHEAAHIRWFDVLYKWLMLIIVCAFWYNPFVWIMYFCACRDIEYACDEAVLKKYSGSGADYSDTIITLEEKRSFDAVSSGFSEDAVKKRISVILRNKNKGFFSFFFAALFCLVTLASFISLRSGVYNEMGVFIKLYPQDEECQHIPAFLVPQKYYLNGTVGDDYIEVFPDNTVAAHIPSSDGERNNFYISDTGIVFIGLESSLTYSGFSVIDERTLKAVRVTKDDEREEHFYYALTSQKSDWEIDNSYRPPNANYYAEDGSYVRYINSTLQHFSSDGTPDEPVFCEFPIRNIKTGEVLLAVNYVGLPYGGQPTGYICKPTQNHTDSLTDTETGKEYTMGTKHIFS